MKKNKFKEIIKGIFRKLYYHNFRFVLLVILIIIAGNVGLYLKDNGYGKAEESPILSGGVLVKDRNEKIEEDKNTQSDINGLSVYDKQEMGLSRVDGSDSDHDGLTDKEEIEVYGSDPLKASTAGDLYTDKYKVDNDMDLFTYYEYKEKMEFPYIECPEFTVTPSNPLDFNTVITDASARYTELSSFGIDEFYIGYELYNYGGKVSIDIHDILVEHDAKEIEIYVTEGPFLTPEMSEFTKCKYKLDGEVANVDYEFDRESMYLIYIAKKNKFSAKGIVNGIFKQFYKPEDKMNFESYFDGDDRAEAIVYGFPWLNWLGVSYTVKYTKCVSDENTTKLINDMNEYVDNKVFEAQVKKKFKEVDNTAFKQLKGFFEDKLGRKFHYIPGEKNSYVCLLFVYSEYVNSYGEDTHQYQNRHVENGFDIYEDELPFQNFQSYISNGGNCAGIAHLTSYLYNKETLPTSGSYDFWYDNETGEELWRGQHDDNDELRTITWDISGDEENRTLSDMGLGDYKTADFIDTHSAPNSNYIGAGLTEGEEQFVNMIGCFWKEGNDKVDLSLYENYGKQGDDISSFYAIKDQLDKGKILDMYMYMIDGSAHAVNIYGYIELKYIDNIFTLLIYDNNIPRNQRAGYTPEDKDYNFIRCYLYRDENGEFTRFKYDYEPLRELYGEYGASSYNFYGKEALHSFVVMDEDWNIIATSTEY